MVGEISAANPDQFWVSEYSARVTARLHPCRTSEIAFVQDQSSAFRYWKVAVPGRTNCRQALCDPARHPSCLSDEGLLFDQQRHLRPKSDTHTHKTYDLRADVS